MNSLRLIFRGYLAMKTASQLQNIFLNSEKADGLWVITRKGPAQP